MSSFNLHQKKAMHQISVHKKGSDEMNLESILRMTQPELKQGLHLELKK